MYTYSYLEINTCCILIQLIILRHHLRGLDKSMTAKCFTLLQVCTIVYILLDMICGLQENGMLILTRRQNEIANLCFFLSSYLVAYVSFVFAECEMEKAWLKNWRKCLVSAVPLIIMTVATIFSLKGKYFFYIDENARYIKGPLYPLLLVGAYGYIMLVAVQAMFYLVQKKYYAQKKKLVILSSFVIFPLAAGILQAFYTGLSIICLGGTIAIIQVYISLQENRITIDTLTQINNRSRLMQYLENRMQNYPEAGEKSLFFVMIDMDQFKQINDTYGHVEGDEALVNLSSALKEACKDHSTMLARYGGDEFSIVCEATDREMIRLCRSIRENVALVNRTAQKPYDIEISMGYAKVTQEIQTIPDLIIKADRELYLEKAKKKKARGL